VGRMTCPPPPPGTPRVPNAMQHSNATRQSKPRVTRVPASLFWLATQCSETVTPLETGRDLAKVQRHRSSLGGQVDLHGADHLVVHGLRLLLMGKRQEFCKNTPVTRGQPVGMPTACAACRHKTPSIYSSVLLTQPLTPQLQKRAHTCTDDDLAPAQARAVTP
jgi:hypothetical protein